MGKSNEFAIKAMRFAMKKQWDRCDYRWIGADRGTGCMRQAMIEKVVRR
jgi:hypothetical protein